VVREWEGLVVDVAARTKTDTVTDQALTTAVFAGFLLWVVHARARFGDAARVVDEPSLDLDGAGGGFLESRARAGRHKTGHAAKRWGSSMPMVACVRGLAGNDWATAWLELRTCAGLRADSDGCLMPEVLADWSFGAGRMSTGTGGIMIKQMLRDLGVPEAEAYGTHSAKATILSWAAKAGMSHDDRRLLGGHADPRDRSLLEYSRDAMAGPLVRLAALLATIRCGDFDPDSTRSGRWKRQRGVPKPPESSEEKSDSGTSDREPSTDSSAVHALSPEPSVDDGVVSDFGFWVSLRGKAHRATDHSSSAVGCGYVFGLGKAARHSTSSGFCLCRRAGCFQNIEKATSDDNGDQASKGDVE